ncbi:MAG: prepilin-type N-terminal cleavage/methylation domain-containing protein [Polyangiales bacterium]
MSARRRRHAAPQAGYTLVELMIAVLITSIVVGSLYSVSKQATETFNQQQRTAEMQLRLRFAMEQLRADIARAGFMSTPNSFSDPRVCPKPTTLYQAVEVSRPAPRIPLPSENRFVNPVTLRLTGNYASVDEYSVAGITGGTIVLQNQTPQWARITSAAQFNRIFLGGAGGRRLLRITSPNGQSQFVQVIGGVYQTASSAALPQLLVTPPPVLVGDGSSGSSAGAACGITGLGTGSTVAPISMVEYAIDNISTTLPELYSTDALEAAAKTDLVRREFNLLPGPVEIPGSARVVGEYAVDLDVALAIDVGNPLGSATGMVSMRTIPFSDTTITQVVGSLSTVGTGTARPERLRSMIVRLSIRDRQQDPAFPWVARPASTYPLTRFRVFDDRLGSARVRTLTTEVAVPNVAMRNLR